jgi:hypothetical protein
MTVVHMSEKGQIVVPKEIREYGLTVATRNVRHFPFCQVENPFELKDPRVQPAS